MKIGENSTILLVEDDPNDVFLMRRALQQAKIHNPLQVAINGEEAIHYLGAHGKYADRAEHPFPSLIFLDLKLPYKNGFDVLKWIREQPPMETTLVVVLTSSSEQRDIEETYRLGARSFLVKPPTQKMLVELMESLKEYWLKYNEYPAIPDSTDAA